MSAYDDLPLGGAARSAPPPAPPPQPSTWRLVIVAVVTLAAGAALAFWWITRAQPDEPTPALTAASDTARSSNRPLPQPMDLPALGASDALVRDLVSLLSKHPTLARLMATDQLIRSAVLAVEQIGEGRTPSQPLAALRPTSRLAITGGDSGPIDPTTYARWQPAIDALASTRPPEAAQLYVNLKSLFDAAYADLGYPGGDFDAAITRAIDVLAAAPVPAAPPVLLRRPAYYEHSDATLRGLRPVQKQLLLTGPEGQRRIVDWLRQFATALDLPVTR